MVPSSSMWTGSLRASRWLLEESTNDSNRSDACEAD